MAKSQKMSADQEQNFRETTGVLEEVCSLEEQYKKQACEIKMLRDKLEEAEKKQKDTYERLCQSQDYALMSLKSFLPNSRLEDVSSEIEKMRKLKIKLRKNLEGDQDFSIKIEASCQELERLIQLTEDPNETDDYSHGLEFYKKEIFQVCETTENECFGEMNPPDNIYDEEDETIWYPSLLGYIDSINEKFEEENTRLQIQIEELRDNIF